MSDCTLITTFCAVKKSVGCPSCDSTSDLDLASYSWDGNQASVVQNCHPLGYSKAGSFMLIAPLNYEYSVSTVTSVSFSTLCV